MIYRNSDLAQRFHWRPEPGDQAGMIARDFLAGELDLLRFSGADVPLMRDLSFFLESAQGLDVLVHRSATGELLISAGPWSEALLLTGRTADVLRAYLDSHVVRMEDRFDMTVRQAVSRP